MTFIDRLFDRLTEEQEQKSCENCIYYRKGNCITVDPQLCKDNDYILWYKRNEYEE